MKRMAEENGIYITLPDKKVQMYDRDFDVYMKYFKLFRESCEKWIGDADIKIAVENTDGFRDYEKKVIEYLLESPCFVLTWDIGHSKAMKNHIAKKYAIVGGAGHTTETLRLKMHEKSQDYQMMKTAKLLSGKRERKHCDYEEERTNDQN